MSHADQPKTVPVPLFHMGRVVATHGALRMLEQAGVSAMDLIARHVSGDWDDLCEEDQEANRQAVRHGGRVFSSYGIGLSATKVWVITEADFSSTCVLLPEEY